MTFVTLFVDGSVEDAICTFQGFAVVFQEHDWSVEIREILPTTVEGSGSSGIWEGTLILEERQRAKFNTIEGFFALRGQGEESLEIPVLAIDQEMDIIESAKQIIQTIYSM